MTRPRRTPADDPILKRLETERAYRLVLDDLYRQREELDMELADVRQRAERWERNRERIRRMTPQ